MTKWRVIPYQRIAEGNPDPDRIGAFGVGFYSLFSIAEEPIVSSGDELMGFFWKDDALFTRRATSPSKDVSTNGKPWTTFHMALREPAPFPDSLLDLSRFLATSLTFTANVRQLSLFFDDKPLCKLNKRLEPPKAMSMPGHLNATTGKKMMRVHSLESTAMRLDVEAMRLVLDLVEKPKWIKPSLTSAFTKTAGGGGGAFATMLQNAFGRSSSSKEKQATSTPSTPATPESSGISTLEKTARSMTTVSSSVHVRIVTATASVSVDRAFEREIERSTKKPPPKQTKIQVIAQNKDEADASSKEGDDAKEIFKGITPSLDSQGFVFIGFKTSQTTSFSGHLAARFIPTVERESIDFIDRYCAQWNNELLAVGGYVTRAVYEAELYEVGKLWNEKLGTARPKDDDETAKWLLDRGLHLMRFFTFRASTPSPRVYSSLETAFFASARQQTLTLASTRGVKHSALVRFPNAILSEFVKDLAVIPPSHVEGAQEFIGQVRARGLVGEITMDDVLSELSGRALEVGEMVACLKWWISVSNHVNYDPSLRRRLLDSAIVQIKRPDGSSSDDKGDTFQPLASVSTFLNPQRVPTDVPLPVSCLSYEVSKAFSASDLARVFGWTELSLPSWLSHIVELARSRDTAPDINIELSPAFSEKVFGILARAWGSMPSHRHEEIAKIVKDVACIPTRKGMNKPADSYFANVSLFEDLPILAFPSTQVKGNLERVLAALGVRRHVELQMIFDRLVAAGNWDVTQLVSYLAANKDTLTKLELERLTKTAMFPKAGEVGPPGKDGKPRIIRYRASQLYEPIDSLRALNLPVLDWPGKPWRQSSDEAKFAHELGLRRHPPIEELLALASDRTSDVELRGRALAYLLDKITTVYKDSYTLKLASSFAFVPCEAPSTEASKTVTKWCKPTEVFTNVEASCLGFAIVSKSINVVDLPKLQLRANPTSTQIITKLVNEPSLDIEHAKKVFEYLSTVADITVSDYGRLKSAAFIPVIGKASSIDKKSETKMVKLAAPSECYFATKSASTAQMRDVLMDVFTFVDFGEKAAVFLRNCGVANEPSIEEVATKLVQTPQRFYSIGGVDAYLGILRQIANNWNRIRTPLRQEMKRSAFLLASKRISPTASSSKGNPKNLMDADIDDDEEDTDDSGMLVHDLQKPGDVVIVDDATSHMLFASQLFVVPHEDLLEAFASELGAPKLSQLVEERFVAAGRPTSNTKLANEVKALVLERTPLFLFEKRQSGKSEIRRDADWLKNKLEVLEVDGAGLRQTRTLHFGRISATNEQKCSAMASMQEGKLLLFIASNLEIDYFEVAMALSKHLLSRQRLQEVLLFMTLLSTSLRNLKRRGFHVDKILSQRKADKEAADRAMREERARLEREALEQPSDAQIKEWVQHMLAVFPDASPEYVERLLRSAKGDRVIEATNAMLETPYPNRPQPKPFADDAPSSSPSDKAGIVAPPTSSAGAMSGGGGFLSNWRSRFKGSEGRSSLADGTSSIEGIPGGWGGPPIAAAGRAAAGAGGGGNPHAPPTQAVATTRNPNPNADVTPSSNIKRRVLSAVEASRGGPRNDDRIQSQGQQTQVKEAAQTYCDTTGIATDLRLAGQVGGMNVYVSPELDPAETLQNNDAALKRFIHQIILPIGTDVFDLDPRSLNVFADVKGPSIAFNRGGALFLNLRYHLVWHDEQVKLGRLDEALISTYHSLAHELAHNVVAQHDSEHEFWFSSICEQYFTRFATLVAKASST